MEHLFQRVPVEITRGVYRLMRTWRCHIAISILAILCGYYLINIFQKETELNRKMEERKVKLGEERLASKREEFKLKLEMSIMEAKKRLQIELSEMNNQNQLKLKEKEKELEQLKLQNTQERVEREAKLEEEKLATKREENKLKHELFVKEAENKQTQIELTEMNKLNQLKLEYEKGIEQMKHQSAQETAKLESLKFEQYQQMEKYKAELKNEYDLKKAAADVQSLKVEAVGKIFETAFTPQKLTTTDSYFWNARKFTDERIETPINKAPRIIQEAVIKMRDGKKSNNDDEKDDDGP